MIYYQLPNGNGVYLSVDQYLNLTHNDIQGLVADGAGSSSNNPFRKLSKPSDDYEKEEEEEIDFPDMLSDGDDDPFTDFDINQIPDS